MPVSENGANLYARFYCMSILDKHHHPDISLDEGLKILEMCTDELKRRLPIDFKGVRCSILRTARRLFCSTLANSFNRF